MLAKPVPQMEEENVFITIEAIDGGRPALRTAQRVIVWSTSPGWPDCHIFFYETLKQIRKF